MVLNIYLHITMSLMEIFSIQKCERILNQTFPTTQERISFINFPLLFLPLWKSPNVTDIRTFASIYVWCGIKLHTSIGIQCTFSCFFLHHQTKARGYSWCQVSSECDADLSCCPCWSIFIKRIGSLVESNHQIYTEINTHHAQQGSKWF